MPCCLYGYDVYLVVMCFADWAVSPFRMRISFRHAQYSILFHHILIWRSGKIVIDLIGRINKCGVISPRFDVRIGFAKISRNRLTGCARSISAIPSRGERSRDAQDVSSLIDLCVYFSVAGRYSVGGSTKPLITSDCCRGSGRLHFKASARNTSESK